MKKPYNSLLFIVWQSGWYWLPFFSDHNKLLFFACWSGWLILDSNSHCLFTRCWYGFHSAMYRRAGPYIGNNGKSEEWRPDTYKVYTIYAERITRS